MGSTKATIVKQKSYTKPVLKKFKLVKKIGTSTIFI